MNMYITEPELPKLNIPYDELKSVVIERIRASTSFQFSSVVSNVANFVGSKEIGFKREANTTYQPKLNQGDEKLIREILWDLVIQRVLTIGDFHNNGWPYFSQTAYGEKILASNEPIPHDPSKYLERIKKEIPNIDPIILLYLSESINTYNINQLLSSTMALGCASEKALKLLIDAYQKTFNKEDAATRFEQKVKNRMIKIQFEEFHKDIKRVIGVLPKNLSDNFENIVLGVFEMFRNQRNSVGHPTGTTVEKEMLFANLQVFIIYCKRIYELINYFEDNKHE